MPPPETGIERARAHDASHALGLSIDDEQVEQLLAYLALLQRWNTTYNLTAVRDLQAMWIQHVVDCMAAIPAVRRHLPKGRRARILDVGSGGGLPGVVWAILMPEADITCVDTVGKKAAFIRQVAGTLRLRNLQARHARVETLKEPGFDLITSRAFASLADFTRLTRHLVAPSGEWLAMKGKVPTDELTALGWPASMFHVEPVQVPGLDAERCLVWLQGPADR